MNQGDVLLFQTGDGGNITIERNSDVKLTGGFETDFFLSLFGGNEDDNGSPNNKKSWWANLLEDDPAFQIRSRTQNLLISLPLVSGNLRKIEDAVKKDLKSYIDLGAITDLAVVVSIIGPRRVKIVITALADSQSITITFLANWQAMESEFAVKPSEEKKNIAIPYEDRILTKEDGTILTTETGEILIVKVKK